MADRRHTRARRHGLDFEAINQAALRRLPELLTHWLPGGRRCGNEWEARNPLRADTRIGSFKVNLATGRWADFALANVRGGDVISLAAYLAGCSQVESARKLARTLGLELDHD
jgi:hypothetical protein